MIEYLPARTVRFGDCEITVGSGYSVHSDPPKKWDEMTEAEQRCVTNAANRRAQTIARMGEDDENMVDTLFWQREQFAQDKHENYDQSAHEHRGS